MNTTLRVVAAFALAAPFASVSLADASAPPPPPPADRGLLSGPDVDKDASQGRRQFGPGDARMRDGDREGQQGRRGAGAMRRFANRFDGWTMTATWSLRSMSFAGLIL